MSNKLQDAIHGCMLAIMRRSGVQISFEQMEAIKVDCDGLANAILELVREESLVPAKRLQKATLDAFKAMEQDIEHLEKQIEYLIKISGVDPNQLEETLKP